MDRNKTVSRREFLKLAGVAGATVAAGGGIASLVAACGGAATTTTTGAAPSTTAATTATTGASPSTTATTAAAQTTTTASAGAQAGRDIKIGLVAPSTGALASFATPDGWWTQHALKAVADGVVCGDKQLHKFQIVVRDSQSDTNRASQVAGDLVNNEKVDMLMASGSPDTVNPTADQAEALATPCLSNFVPWQPFYFGRGATPDKPFTYTYTQAVGLEDLVSQFFAIWATAPNNKKVAFICANDADGVAWSDAKTGLPPIFQAAGYTYIEPQLFPPGSEDFTQQISVYKKNGCDIVCGPLTPPDFNNFWKQSVQQGFHPPFCTIAKALLFPQTVTSMGPLAYNTTVECVWHPTWPFKDSLTGMTCQQLADEYEQVTGQQWTMPIGELAKFEWAVDVYKRANPDDKQAVLSAIKTSKLDTCLGPIDFTAPVDMTDLNKSKHPVPNVCKPPMSGGQWIKGTGKWPFDMVVVSNANSPEIPVAAKVLPMQYT
jgi:branched-chain amino acid transport system substrate-binding protein